MFAKNPYELKYQLLIEKRDEIGFKYFRDRKVFTEYSSDMTDAYKNTTEYNPEKERKVLIVFDDMIANMISVSKVIEIVTELFIRHRKLIISFVFISESF